MLSFNQRMLIMKITRRLLISTAFLVILTSFLINQLMGNIQNGSHNLPESKVPDIIIPPSIGDSDNTSDSQSADRLPIDYIPDTSVNQTSDDTANVAYEPKGTMWIDPPTISFSPENASIGDTFTITVWLNITSGDVFGYQIALLYDRTMIRGIKAGYTEKDDTYLNFKV